MRKLGQLIQAAHPLKLGVFIFACALLLILGRIEVPPESYTSWALTVGLGLLGVMMMFRAFWGSNS